MLRSSTILLALVAVAFLFQGCEGWTEKKFSTTLNYEFVIDQPQGTGPYVVDLNGLVDVLQTNAELEKAKEKIKSFKIIQVRYKVWEYYNDPANTFTGFLGFGSKSMTSPEVQYGLTDFILQESMNSESPALLNFNTADADRLADYFLNTNGLTLFLDGSLTTAPAQFKLQISMDVDAVADVEK